MKPGLRFEVFKRDGFTCRYCGRQSPGVILEVDHVLPRAKGGTDDFENLVTSCWECNRGKAAKPLEVIPAEADLHEKAVSIAERELQIAELTRWRMVQQEREEREIEFLTDHFESQWGPGAVAEPSLRYFIRHIHFIELGEVMDWVGANERVRTADHAWRLFCSLAHKRIRGE